MAPTIEIDRGMAFSIVSAYIIRRETGVFKFREVDSRVLLRVKKLFPEAFKHFPYLDELTDEPAPSVGSTSESGGVRPD